MSQHEKLPYNYYYEPLTHYDGVKVASHEHGGVLGREVEVAGREEGRQLSHCLVRLLQVEAV